MPGQASINSILKVNVGAHQSSISTTSELTRAFAQSVDWSNYSGLKFWYYGNNSGKDVTVNVTGTLNDPGASGWVQVWGDEFNGSTGSKPDPNKWGYTMGIFNTPELEYYTDKAENASMDGNGNLAIVARKVTDPAASGLVCFGGPCEYSSAMLNSHGHFDFTYGRAEARIKLPYGQGIWPAFWMLAADYGEVNWPDCGEVDIMENKGKEPGINHGTVHGPGYSDAQSIGNSYLLANNKAFKDDFHSFAVEWEPNVIRWYVDNNLYFTMTPDKIPAGKRWVFDHPFYLILNIAVGGGFPGYPDQTSIFPQTMLVDYVRVYQATGTPQPVSFTFKDNSTGWSQITAPFGQFKFATDQGKIALRNGVTFNQVWGYGFEYPTSETPAVYYFDRILLTDWYKSMAPLILNSGKR